MNSTHDLGGMHGFGAIDQSQQDNFAAPWEETVFSLTLACGFLGQWNLDQSRFAREQMDPGEYLSSSYYEHWLHGLERLLLEKGLVSADELETGKADGVTDLEAVPPQRVPFILQNGAPTELTSLATAAFRVGDSVRVQKANPRGHTRVPRYCRGCAGIVKAHYGAHIFPDRHCREGVKEPQHLYSIQFDAAQLWGQGDAEPSSAVYIDLFESYLEVDG